MFSFTDHTIQSVFCCCCCCTVQKRYVKYLSFSATGIKISTHKGLLKIPLFSVELLIILKFKDRLPCISLMKAYISMNIFMLIFIDTCSHKYLMFFKIRAMRTKMNLDPDTGLVTQYSASQPDVSYASTWKCRVSNVLAGENRELR